MLRQHIIYVQKTLLSNTVINFIILFQKTQFDSHGSEFHSELVYNFSTKIIFKSILTLKFVLSVLIRLFFISRRA